MKTISDPATHAWHLSEIFKKSDWFAASALLLIFAMLALARATHYLLFHVMAELSAIVVSLSIFVLTWLSSRYLVNGYLIVMGGSYAAVGLVDILHTLTFKGMNLFEGVTTNHPTQFWLTARFMEALALLCAPFLIDKQPRFYKVSIFFAALGVAACIAVIYRWFPATFIDGVGLTPFKVYSEYVIIAMLAIGFVMLYRSRHRFEPRIYFLLVASLVLAAMTEFCFTRYTNFYDFSNEVGHYLRFMSVALAFMAIVLSGVRQPFELIFREMLQHKCELDALNTKLRESESNLKHAQKVAKFGSWHIDIANGNILSWSDETYRIFGMPQGTAPLFASFVERIHADDRAFVLAAWQSALEHQPYDIEHRIVAGDDIRWVREVAEITFADEGTALSAMGTVQDITDRKRIEETLKESERRMSAVFQSSPIGIIITQLMDGTIIEVNDAALRQFGYTRADALGHRSVDDLGAYIDPAQRDTLVQRLKERGSLHQFPVDYRTRNGSHIVLELSSQLIQLHGTPCVLSLTVDVTERKCAEAIILEQAFHDPLTHLPNRRLLSDRLQQIMSAARRSACHGALMYLDLDNFKPLNDNYGHEVGDLLLMEVASRLKACVRETDTVARVGGDEFVVMLSELDTDHAASAAQAQTVASKIRSSIANPYLLTLQHNGHPGVTVEHHCTVSIGVVLFVDDEAHHREVISWADTAMYQAKRTGRNTIRFYIPDKSLAIEL